MQMKENMLSGNVNAMNIGVGVGNQEKMSLLQNQVSQIDSKLTDAVIEIRDLLVEFKNDYNSKK